MQRLDGEGVAQGNLLEPVETRAVSDEHEVHADLLAEGDGRRVPDEREPGRVFAAKPGDGLGLTPPPTPAPTTAPATVSATRTAPWTSVFPGLAIGLAVGGGLE